MRAIFGMSKILWKIRRKKDTLCPVNTLPVHAVNTLILLIIDIFKKNNGTRIWYVGGINL